MKIHRFAPVFEGYYGNRNNGLIFNKIFEKVEENLPAILHQKIGGPIEGFKIALRPNHKMAAPSVDHIDVTAFGHSNRSATG